MKRYIIMLMTALFCLSGTVMAAGPKTEGKCGVDCKWQFDGRTLTITNINQKGYFVSMNNYDATSNLAPWVKKGLDVKKVVIGANVLRIGSCAFANLENLQEVVFTGTYLLEIGWGAFYNCKHLRNVALPSRLKLIEDIAFANCSSITNIKIPDHCRVENQVFANCTNLQSLEIDPTVILGRSVFATEVMINDTLRHKLYEGEILRLPAYINKRNCAEYGIAQTAFEGVKRKLKDGVDYDLMTSSVDSIIPVADFTRNEVYALVIGNQNYRFASEVPYAIHDARVFAEYCKKTLGVPALNIHLSEDATKQMILEEEIADWLEQIPGRAEKNLIVYYAGHGVPDIKTGNSYLLPTDVRGTSPKRGILLNDFYAKLADLGFAQTAVFLDACFSGVNRESGGVVDNLRAVEIAAKAGQLTDGSVVVFSAAQGSETAQGYPEEGHGLFTYYLLRELADSYGTVSFGSLADNLKKNVSDRAPQLKMHKPQTPTTQASESIADNWRYFQF